MAEDGIIVAPLRTMPRLYLDLSISYEAFWTLSSSRPVGFGGQGLIPFSEIEAYLRFRRITNPDMQDEIVENVRFLDSQYLTYMRKEQEAAEARKKQGGPDGN